jgi:transposase
MFVRRKKSGGHEYLQIVHNERVDGKVRQRTVATLGRLDRLREDGVLDSLAASLAKFSLHSAVLTAHRAGQIPAADCVRFGPVVVFERLWEELGIGRILGALLDCRRFSFPVERVLFVTVLHRLFAPGSDRSAESWCRRYAIEGIEQLELHHFYRAMAWLGEAVGEDQQHLATPFAPRCTKDLIEERLFDWRRDLFTDLSVVFFDTTSIYFEGAGGETIGQYGNSKDHRRDLRQMVVGVVIDGEGHPVCCEMWPGNTTDVKSLVPVIQRLRTCFGVKQVCIVADRGMISKETIRRLGEPDLNCRFILGARMRRNSEVAKKVLSRPGRYREVAPPRSKASDPSPLKVKEVWVEDRRYVVCLNEEQARKDRADREAIVKHLERQLHQGDKSLVGNKGYRKYLKADRGNHFRIDEDKLKAEERLDGKWVLSTDTELTAAETALKYKELWMVEDVFRDMKSILQTRPIYHRHDETIRGHVFCSFLALVLLKELYRRMEQRGWHEIEWNRLREDLEALQRFTVCGAGKSFLIRTHTEGDVGRALQAAGVALGSPVTQIS